MATRRGTGRDARASRGRASLALVAVPVTVLLALSAFGENANGSTRGRGGREGRGARRFGGDAGAASALAMARDVDEGLGRARARAVDYDKVRRERRGSTTTTTTTTTREDAAEATRRYAVVLDAGSTGSRAHVFAFERAGRGLKLLDDHFEAVKPGLSARASDPKAAAESLRTLMTTAMNAVPAADRAETSVELRATAGLRLLPGDASSDILAECKKLLKEYPFKFDDESVSIMDGADEGAYQWLTMNYLLGNLANGGADHDGDVQTVAAVDLGGGSVQLAYQVPPESVANAPDGYITKLKALGHSFDVYTRSHLGHGLMAARAAVLAQAEERGGSPCVHAGYDGVYEYAGKTYKASARDSGSDHASCYDVAVAALGVDKECERPKQCSFDGAWGGEPGAGSKRVYMSSYLWDRAVNVGIVTDDEIDGRAAVNDFKAAAEKACGVSVAEVTTKYHGVEPKDAPFLCMDLTFAYALLNVGFGRHGWRDFTLVKQIEYQGKPVEAAWPLGAALNSM